MRPARIVTLLLLLSVAACDRPADPGPSAPPGPAAVFKHRMNSDLSGYYLPVGEVRIGKWAFDHVFLGQAADFQSWEAGSRSGAFAPVMLQFNDATSPMVETETGEAHSVTVRVLPTAYSVTGTSISFVGQSPDLGAISFEGMLDPGALSTARRNLGHDGAVVTGALRIGESPARNVQLRWWGGD